MQDQTDSKLQDWREAYHLFKESQARAKSAGKRITHEVRAEVAALQRKAEVALRQLQGPATSPPEHPERT
jgi:hypothetical protein